MGNGREYGLFPSADVEQDGTPTSLHAMLCWWLLRNGFCFYCGDYTTLRHELPHSRITACVFATAITWWDATLHHTVVARPLSWLRQLNHETQLITTVVSRPLSSLLWFHPVTTRFLSGQHPHHPVNGINSLLANLIVLGCLPRIASPHWLYTAFPK